MLPKHWLMIAAALGVGYYFFHKTPIGKQIRQAYPWNGLSATPNATMNPTSAVS